MPRWRGLRSNQLYVWAGNVTMTIRYSSPRKSLLCGSESRWYCRNVEYRESPSYKHLPYLYHLPLVRPQTNREALYSFRVCFGTERDEKTPAQQATQLGPKLHDGWPTTNRKGRALVLSPKRTTRPNDPRLRAQELTDLNKNPIEVRCHPLPRSPPLSSCSRSPAPLLSRSPALPLHRRPFHSR